MNKGLALVSGATGFIGTEVARQFADAGYSVRATARSPAKIAAWKESNPDYESIQWVVVADATLPGCFTKAIRGVKYVVHCAGPFHYNFQPEDNATTMLLPVVNMGTAIIEAAVTEPSVEHMVVTSSFAAVLNWNDLPNADYTYTGKDWNTATFDESLASKNPVFVYCAAKELGERVILDRRDRKFRVTSICPPVVYGPPRQAIKSMNDLNTSMKAIWSLINGKSTDPVPPSGVISGTDNRDVAALHVRAVETAHTVSHDRRLLAIAFHRFNCEHVAGLCKSFADSPEKLGRIKNGGGDPMYEHYASDSSEAEALLGKPFISAEECIKDTALRLWEIENTLQQQQN